MRLDRLFLARLSKFVRFVAMDPSTFYWHIKAQKSGVFDAQYYRNSHPGLHAIFRAFPVRHYTLWGEDLGLQPNPDFCPKSYLRLNPDVAKSGQSAFKHFFFQGRHEGRQATKFALADTPLAYSSPNLRFDPNRAKSPYAVHLHIYYPELWPEFYDRLCRLEVDADVYITITWRGDISTTLADEIQNALPKAHVHFVPNRGRDILPFVSLVNAGAFDGYAAVCKIHTKKSPHRIDGDAWRTQLVNGILPSKSLRVLLDKFIAAPDAAFWVSDGQRFHGRSYWGSNRARTADLLRRIESEGVVDQLDFPAGSMYWTKPLMIGLIKSLDLSEDLFEPEEGQVDGTLAHAFERAIGGLATVAGQRVIESRELEQKADVAQGLVPAFVTAFYLPQFHPIPENDAWWGKGFTEWTSVTKTQSNFPGHLQPMKPADLGFYDLRATEVMGQQADLAKKAGIDAFCVYHYWFDPKRVLETPLDKLIARPEIDFPFYLCWANESWRRNWDGLSGHVLLEQAYREGFEERLVQSTLVYMNDPRYQRPDGKRPRFVIYRPEDFPDPARSVENLRAAWRAHGIGEVELGAVSFHIKGKSPVAESVFDFWVEMPPHGLVKGEDYLFGGPLGNQMAPHGPPSEFTGLIYDYRAIAARSCHADHIGQLPKNTIAGIMPSWDNTARRGRAAHIAMGANPASFGAWLAQMRIHRIPTSYRNELFINAWNEWAERAILEPSDRFGMLYLDVLKSGLCDG